MLLSDILYKVKIKAVSGDTSIEVDHLHADSRKVSAGGLFVAVKGLTVDGHDFITQVIAEGAVAIVCEILPEAPVPGVTFVCCEDSSEALGIMSSNFYGNPSTNLKLVGITGTNGKTTVATLLHSVFTDMGYNVGLLSTVRNLVGTKVHPSKYTTPDPVSLNSLLNEMVEAGCEYVFMEVSSHAIVQERIAGLSFTGGVFTNLTHDHLDYHKTMDGYLKAKKRFFDELSPSAFALTNKDDKTGPVMLQNTKASKHSYSLKSVAEFKAVLKESSLLGLNLEIDGDDMHSLLIGEFNAYNILAIYGTARLLGIEKMDLLIAISKLTAVEGRFQYLRSKKDNIIGIVDYAHTPDALKNVLNTINDIKDGNASVITVVGCGGDRDKDKRPVMARIAAQLSNKLIITSDNPRTEDPELIIKDMEAGILPHHKKRALSISDRKEAIKTACTLAEEGDVILVAGKGHEDYQEINGERFHFDDKEVLAESFQLLER